MRGLRSPLCASTSYLEGTGSRTQYLAAARLITMPLSRRGYKCCARIRPQPTLRSNSLLLQSEPDNHGLKGAPSYNALVGRVKLRVCFLWLASEHEPKSELPVPGAVVLAVDYAEAVLAKRRIGRAEPRRIERVEKLSANLEELAFRELDSFGKTQVDVVNSMIAAIRDITAHIAGSLVPG